MCTFTIDRAAPVISSTLNRNTSVITISIINIDALYDYLMPFFLSMPFQTRKGVDFSLWCLALYMYKWGYAYLIQGRKLLVLISKYINSGRYTNSNVTGIAPESDTISEVLNYEVPVERTPEMNQLEYAKAIARTVTSRSIYIYDNGVLVNTTPYTNYGDAQEAIGLSRTSRAVSRNIDTGKAYLGRYSFYSTLQN